MSDNRCLFRDNIECGHHGECCEGCGWEPCEEEDRIRKLNDGRYFAKKTVLLDLGDRVKKKKVRFLTLAKRQHRAPSAEGV